MSGLNLGGESVQIKSLILGIVLIAIACPVNAGSEEDFQCVEEAVTSTDEEAIGLAVMSLKIEALKWKKQFYAQKSEAMQLKYMIQCWNDPDFQEVQRIGRETDKELKRLLILQ